MVNTRGKIRKTLNTPKPRPSVEDSDQQSTDLAALIGSNDDLLTEILLRLPVTSILRFKSVSKHWRLLLSDRHFTHRYDKLLKSPDLFVRDKYVPYDVENPSTPPFRSLDFCSDPNGIRIKQSCNGLLLCCTDRLNGGTRRYYVFNPTTKQFATIRSIPGGYNASRTICFMGLAFHQTDCVHYKLVCIRELDSVMELYQILIYSSDTRKWKISIQSFSPCKHRYFSNPVYWNGAVYWAPCYHNHSYFKIEEEVLQTLPLPVEMTSLRTSQVMYFEESRGHLHLILYDYQHHGSLCLNVYEMLSDHLGWTIKYQVPIHELRRAFLEMNRFPSDCIVVDMVRGEKEDDTFMVVITHRKVIRYNFHDKSCKQIFGNISWMEGHCYIETLSSF